MVPRRTLEHTPSDHMGHFRTFYILSLLANIWHTGVEGCLGLPTYPSPLVPSALKGKRDTSKLTESACKPYLPSLLLQQYPASADDAALQPILRTLETIVSRSANSVYMDSISIGVVGSQGLLWSKGFGRAQANGTRDAPPNEHTIYRIASISKLFATMEGFVLSDRGVINWYAWS